MADRGARLIGGLLRLVRDLDLAEDLAQEALVTALERWPASGIPDNPGAWLMATARNRALDRLRRTGCASASTTPWWRRPGTGWRARIPRPPSTTRWATTSCA